MIRVNVYSGHGEFLEELPFEVRDASEVVKTLRDAYGAGVLRYGDGRVVVCQESLAAGNYVFRAAAQCLRSKRIKVDDMEKLAQQRLRRHFVALAGENSIDQLPWPFVPMVGSNVNVLISDEAEEFEEAGKEEESEASASFTLRLIDIPGNRLLKAIWGKTGQMKILERPCYKEIWEKIKAYVQMSPNDNAPVLLRGSPGIGKTAFLLYVLVELVEDKKKVLFRTNGGVLYYFAHDDMEGVYHGYKVPSYHDVKLDSDPKIWFLAEGRLPDPPVYLGAAILASTPLKTNYKEFEKDAKMKVFLPIWTASEMALLRQEAFPEVSLEQFKKLYHQWGGIPRRVFENPSEESLSRVISGMPSIQQLVDAVTMQRADSDHLSHQLLYMKVVEGYGSYDLMFASPLVKDAIYKEMRRDSELQLFLRSKGVGSQGFESLKSAILQAAFETHAVGRREYPVREVFESVCIPKAEVQKVTFEFGASKRILTMEEAETDVYDLIFWPENKIEESIEAFVLKKKIDDDERVLQLFHVAVSSHRHGRGVKSNGLLEVMKKFGVTAGTVELYVVTTPELFDEQNWRILRNSRITKKLQGIRQFALACDTA